MPCHAIYYRFRPIKGNFFKQDNYGFRYGSGP